MAPLNNKTVIGAGPKPEGAMVPLAVRLSRSAADPQSRYTQWAGACQIGRHSPASHFPARVRVARTATRQRPTHRHHTPPPHAATAWRHRRRNSLQSVAGCLLVSPPPPPSQQYSATVARTFTRHRPTHCNRGPSPPSQQSSAFCYRLPPPSQQKQLLYCRTHLYTTITHALQ